MKLQDLRAENPTAFVALVELWSELSRCSYLTAMRDLKEDMGLRYEIKKQDHLVFLDHHSGDTFEYDESQQLWK